MKLSVTTKLLYPILLVFGFLIFSTTDAYTQVLGHNIGNTDCVKFRSSHPSEFMHFYIFDDGYYSSKKSPRHKFFTNQILNAEFNTEVYTVKPYEPEEPELEELVVTVPGNGSGNCVYQPIKMDGSIDLDISWNFTLHGKTFILLKYQNEGDNEVSGCLELNYDTSQIEIITDEIKIYNDWALNQSQYISPSSSQFTWEFENLGDARVLYIPAKVNPDNYEQVNLNAKIFHIGEDACDNLIGEIDVEEVVELFPHDPNYIKPVQPYSLTVTKTKTWESDFPEQYLVYEIQFHNEGVDPVRNVRVVYNYPPEVDEKSIKLLRSDHVGYQKGYNEFFFDKIYLPGAAGGNAYEDCISQFRIVVCIDDHLEYLDCIRSSVDIYFDGLEPESSANSTCAEIVTRDGEERPWNHCSLAPSPEGRQAVIPRANDNKNIVANKIQIIPNPCFDYFDLNIDQKINNIKIISLNGAKVLEVKNPISSHVNTNGLAPGMYFLQVDLSSGSQTIKFIKQ